MQQNIRTNKKTSLNLIKETISNNLQNICKISFGLCRHIYHKPFNDVFKEKLEKVQYSAALVFTGAIKALLGNVCTKNLVLNLFVIEGGIVN